jgi:hypothetical protein
MVEYSLSRESRVLVFYVGNNARREVKLQQMSETVTSQFLEMQFHGCSYCSTYYVYIPLLC